MSSLFFLRRGVQQQEPTAFPIFYFFFWSLTHCWARLFTRLLNFTRQWTRQTYKKHQPFVAGPLWRIIKWRDAAAPMAIVGSFPPKEFIRKNQQQQTNKFNFLRCSQSSRKSLQDFLILFTGRGRNTTTLTHDPVINTIFNALIITGRQQQRTHTEQHNFFFFVGKWNKEGKKNKTNTATQTTIIRHPPNSKFERRQLKGKGKEMGMSVVNHETQQMMSCVRVQTKRTHTKKG